MKSHVPTWLRIAAASLVLCASSEAATTNVVYINGINTTYSEALIDRNALRDRLRNSANLVEAAKRKFSVSIVHNPIGWFNVDSDQSESQDRKELFLLMTAEECYASDLNKIVVPHNQSRPIDQGAARRVDAYLRSIIPGPRGGHSCGANTLSDQSDGVNASDMLATQTTAIGLAQKVLSYPTAIVVAHSQGNLLANLAYARIVTQLGNDASKRVRVVNVANTSISSISGLDLTHGNDLAISPALTLLGQAYRRITPTCNQERCNFAVSPPTLGGVWIDQDAANHGFVLTYLSNFQASVVQSQGVSFTLGFQRFRDRVVDFVYAAATSLELVNPPQPVYQKFVQGDPGMPGDGRVVSAVPEVPLVFGFPLLSPIEVSKFPRGFTITVFPGGRYQNRPLSGTELGFDNGLETSNPCRQSPGMGGGADGTTTFQGVTGTHEYKSVAAFEFLVQNMELERIRIEEQFGIRCPVVRLESVRVTHVLPFVLNTNGPPSFPDAIDAVAIGSGANSYPR